MNENPYSAPSSIRDGSSADKRVNSRRIIWAANALLVIGIVIILMVPVGSVAIWDGSFSLILNVEAEASVDLDSVKFSMDHILYPRSERRTFSSARSATQKSSGQWTIDVPCSGRSGFMGYGGTYHQPGILIVDYQQTIDHERTPRREHFTIPKGRGPRSMAIQLP